MKNNDISKVDLTTEENIEKIADEKKREFVKKFGKFALSAPVVGFILMSPSTSKAQTYSDGGAP